MKKIMFSIQNGYSGREANAIISAAHKLGAEYCYVREANFSMIPIGTIEFCEPVFGFMINRKEFYPAFLVPFLYRHIVLLQVDVNSHILAGDRFVKDALKWKSAFKSRIMKAGEILPEGTWLIADPVEFTDEWRYYIADGNLITTGWYAGEHEDEPAPRLEIAYPIGFSGAVDFGRMKDGKMALVEAHAPFACGWYGDDHEDFVLWQAISWENRSWWMP